MKKQLQFKTKGMNRDMSVSAFNPEFSFENMNLRLSTNESNTQMSWVNERGTKKLELSINFTPYNEEGDIHTSIPGTPIGTAVINHQLVLFTIEDEEDEPDNIYVLTYEGGIIKGERIFRGALNFDKDHPLETLVSYESENIQKVYWVDGKNPTRFINIKAGDTTVKRWNTWSYSVGSDVCTAFDFGPDINFYTDSDDGLEITVQKLTGANGMFAPGVIQYAFTYYNQYGQETAIFHTTPLYYISYKDRGAGPNTASVNNAFKITAKNLDTSFDYLRIYSIQRTSLNDNAIAKRVQDISLSDITDTNIISYIDTGTNGDAIDAADLFYKGGEAVAASTIEQKDNTLFLGNLKTSQYHITDSLKENLQKNTYIAHSTRTLYLNPEAINDTYPYTNQLTAFKDTNFTISTPCGGFKTDDIYRLGIQFQYKNGKWSEPIYLKDTHTHINPKGDGYKSIVLPTFTGLLNREDVKTLIELGYRRVRPLVVFPDIKDRVTLCQGIACTTLYTRQHANIDHNLHAQSSWFFRTAPIAHHDDYNYGSINTETGAVMPINYGVLPCTQSTVTYYPEHNDCYNIRQIEIEGCYDSDDLFNINDFYTLHTPEVEFGDLSSIMDFTNVFIWEVGQQYFTTTLSDIDIQTESPTISNEGTGFIHKSFTDRTKDTSGPSVQGNHGIVSGLFYNDFVVDDNSDKELVKYGDEEKAVNWMVFLWSRTGPLNNDINRPNSAGTASAILKKKIVSNLRFAKLESWTTTTDYLGGDSITVMLMDPSPQIFSSDEVSITKLGTQIYQGNIDTLLVPASTDGKYFAASVTKSGKLTSSSDGFTSKVLWRTGGDEDRSFYALYEYNDEAKQYIADNRFKNIGDKYSELALQKNSVRMKYKSTPHLVLGYATINLREYCLPVLEIRRLVDKDTIFGGTSPDALKANTWVPCGDPILLTTTSDCIINYEYGDTYYQRWDCLKTYPFTSEDINQVVEIGSFMLETKQNIDGRYDRNRGQISNLYMTPQNFNLYNPVYSQVDNFFNYKILSEDSYKDNSFPNQVTWTLTKTSGANVDAWTNITLASTLELDGDKGTCNKLIRYNDQLLAFQDTGISQILYNENTQISTTEGVPIELANSGKVQGKRYISSTIGCSNKYSLVQTPSGIYFMDNYDRGIYLFNGQLANLSTPKGFDSWCKQYILNANTNTWTPTGYDNFAAYYDKVNQDVLFINKETALAYSEKFETFTSFYNYGGVPYYVNLDNTGLWVNTVVKHDADGRIYDYSELWEHNAGDYCDFFGEVKPYWMTLVGNPEPNTSKIFTNLELRASVDGDGICTKNTVVVTDSEGNQKEKVIGETFTPTLPFDYLETWDEYQHGFTELSNAQKGIGVFSHYDGDGSTLKRKFRIWRCDIPRDNAVIDNERKKDTTYNYSTDAALNISRVRARPFDRMRNPWLYLKLSKMNTSDKSRVEIHDVMMTYYN